MELNKIYNEDCLIGMQRIDDKSIDCIICDLPYGVLNRKNKEAQWDTIIPFDKLWAQYERIIKDNGAIILFSQGIFTSQLILSNSKLWKYNLIWNKQRCTGFLNAKKMPLRCHEDICVFYKNLPTYNPQFTKGTPNHSRGKGNHKNTNSCYGEYIQIKDEKTVINDDKYPTSIISIPKEHNKIMFHPTQKPVDLIRYLIKTYTNEGDLILDNCIGGGTTAISCIKEKRNFIGFELNKDYYDKSIKRIEDELVDLKEIK